MGEGARPSRPEWTRVRLAAASEGALDDPAVHDTVVSSAEGIAERTGVTLVSIEVDPGGITAVIEGDRLAALGLAAELRRLTGAWYTRHHPGEHLWVEPPPPGDDDDDEGPWGGGGGGGPEDPDDPDEGEDEGGGFRDPYAFNDEDLLMSDPDVLHDMEILEENLTNDPPGSPGTEGELDPDDPYWRKRNDPLGP